MNKLTVVRVTADGIKFNNGIFLSSEHERDCCEYHWLAFEELSLDEFNGLEFDLSNDNFFKKIDGYGIELIPINGFSIRIAGHGSNNGYYSTKLILSLDSNNFHKAFDITECQDINYHD